MVKGKDSQPLCLVPRNGTRMARKADKSRKELRQANARIGVTPFSDVRVYPIADAGVRIPDSG